MLRPAISNEPDRDKRERLDEVRRRLTDEHLNPVHEEAAVIVRDATTRLGAGSYPDLYRRFGFPLDDLASQCEAFLDETRALYERVGDSLFRAQVGVGLADARRWDVPRMFRAASWDPVFARDAMLPALEATLSDLGIDLKRQANVQLDLDERPKKVPRAYCFTIDVPGRVVLMIRPIGGSSDWHALFHEAGHSEHFAHASPDLPFEDRRLGDNALTEGWAFLLEHLVDNPAWLTRRLNVPRVEDIAAEGAAVLLFFVRRYAAKLLYELELHSTDDLRSMRGRYVELLGDALLVEPAAEDYLGDVDEGFYASSYLRAWAFEAQLHGFLQEEFGTDWFRRREAGSLLRELWSLGQQPTADELLRDLTGAGIELQAVADRFR
jgi:hypothetical protein